MNITPFHARYIALLLSRQALGMERSLPALAAASIDLHPHQVDAAVFASRSPYRDGVILADEEGLGKTIEAGIVLLQAYLEDRKRLLVLCPAPLVEFWQNELTDKFSLPLVAVHEIAAGGGVAVLSHQKGYRQADALAAIHWDVCVIDEAHLLANAGLSDHMQANALHDALRGRPKLLLTATPMQNSLLDLHSLVRFVDETTFPSDPEDFRARYMAKKAHRAELASRAQILCQRTLRRQAVTMPEIRRTVRTILTPPSPEEDALSRRLSLYFHRENLLAFPKVKEHHIRLTYWKMLASSPQALHESLQRLCERLADTPGADDEVRELRALAAMSGEIREGARARAFLTVLAESMTQLRQAGAPEKAVIFSENTATLDYLNHLLDRNGYANIVSQYGGMRSKRGLADFARGRGGILLASDGGGTGLDLSHCSLVINYDLPWNIQKLEQRISRCHRYGQKHDVMVINFLDPHNRADRRLYDSLNKKLQRFDHFFGASETILGQLAATDDAPPALRASEAIEISRENAAREALPEIRERVGKAEADLLAHFDEDVRRRFAKYGETIPAALSTMDAWLWELTKCRLGGRASFNDLKRSFVLDHSPYPDLRLRRVTFGMDRSLPPGERYHLGHPLARRILADCLSGDFTLGNMTLKANEAFPAGLSGEIGLWRIGMMSEVCRVTEPVLCGITGDGQPLSPAACAEILKLEPLASEGGPEWDAGEGESYRGRIWRGATSQKSERPPLGGDKLRALRDAAFATVRDRLTLEHDELLKSELARLRQWAEDEEAALKARQEELRRRIADAKAKTDATVGYVDRFRTAQRTAELEKERRREEERLFMLNAEIRRKRDVHIDAAQRKSALRFWNEEMFVAKFKIADNAPVT